MKFINNAQHFKDTVAKNKKEALEALGNKAVDLIVDNMQNGYLGANGLPKPIRQTGALMADVQMEVDGDIVRVGNTLPYSKFVHDGTYKMQGRPYISDALLRGAETLGETIVDEITKGL